jgi:hypothetical protein
MAGEVEAFMDKVEDMLMESDLYVTEAVGALTMIATRLTVAQAQHLNSNKPADSEAAETLE